MARLKLYKCDWTDGDTGDACGEVTRGSVQTTYHRNAHRRMSPKTATVPAPVRRKVYHVSSGDEPRLPEGDSQDE